jgi:hypothetical protein
VCIISKGGEKKKKKKKKNTCGYRHGFITVSENQLHLPIKAAEHFSLFFLVVALLFNVF